VLSYHVGRRRLTNTLPPCSLYLPPWRRACDMQHRGLPTRQTLLLCPLRFLLIGPGKRHVSGALFSTWHLPVMASAGPTLIRGGGWRGSDRLGQTTPTTTNNCARSISTTICPPSKVTRTQRTRRPSHHPPPSSRLRNPANDDIRCELTHRFMPDYPRAWPPTPISAAARMSEGQQGDLVENLKRRVNLPHL
jgi:hypothetical protein